MYFPALSVLSDETFPANSAGLGDQGERDWLPKRIPILPVPVPLHSGDTAYAIYEKSGLDKSFVRDMSERERDGRIWAPPALYDSDTRGVVTNPFMRDASNNDTGPLLNLLKFLAAEDAESIRSRTTKLVVKSEHENINMVSYCISPDLLGKVLDQLPNLDTLRVGLIGVKCIEKHAPNYHSKFRLANLEACWAPLEMCLKQAFCMGRRFDYVSFKEILAMFSHIENLRFVNTSWPSYDRPDAHWAAHGLVAVQALHVTPREPTGWGIESLFEFLHQSIELSALQKLVMDDCCQKLADDINKFLSRTVALTSLSLSFQHPIQRKDIKEGLIDVSKLKRLEEFTLDILVRPKYDSQPEWKIAIETLRKAAYTGVKHIVLRLATRLVPPEDDTEERAWCGRSAADLAADFEKATWPTIPWDTMRAVILRGFRKRESFRVECYGPPQWVTEEHARAVSTFGEILSQFTILDSVPSPKA